MHSLLCLRTSLAIVLLGLVLSLTARSGFGQQMPLTDPRGTETRSTLPERWGTSATFQVQIDEPEEPEVPEPYRRPPIPETTLRECATPEELATVIRPLSQTQMNVVPGPEYLPKRCFEIHYPHQSHPRDATHLARSNVARHFHWKATGLRHYPLYFEEVALERYGLGYSPVLQPVVSGARFYSRVATLPYRLGVDAPNKIIYTLGYERPGNYAPSVRERLPWSLKGAAFQAATVVGGVALFP